MGGHLLSVYSNSQASRLKRLTAYVPISVRRYNHGNKENEGPRVEERAPSTAQEFERVADEKNRQSQTVEKAQDASEESVMSDSMFESVKGSDKEPPGKGNLKKHGSACGDIPPPSDMTSS